MNKAYKPLRGLFAILVGVSAITLVAKLNVAKDRIPWRTDFDAAVAEARRDGKPMMVYFTAVWCEPCQRMRTETWSDRGVEQALSAYVPVKLDIERDTPTALSFGVEPIPAFFVVDVRPTGDGGTILKRGDGFMSPEGFAAWLRPAPPASPASQPSASQPAELAAPTPIAPAVK